MNREAARRTRADPIRSIQIGSAVVQFWRTWGADHAATQNEMVRFVRWSLEENRQPKPKAPTILRVLYGLVADGFLQTRSAGARTILYWPNPGRVDPSFPGFDREAEAMLRQRDPFPVFAADGRAWLAALDDDGPSTRVPLLLRRPYVGFFAWWRSLWYGLEASQGPLDHRMESAIAGATGTARRAVLDFFWQSQEGSQASHESEQTRLMDTKAMRGVRPDHRFGALCPESCCPKERTSLAVISALERALVCRDGALDVARTFSDLDALIEWHARRGGLERKGAGTGPAQSDSVARSIELLRSLEPGRRQTFRQWERAWAAALVGSKGFRAGASKRATPPRPEGRADRMQVVRMVRVHGRDPVEAARQAGVSFLEAARWVEEFDRVALLAPRVRPDVIPGATGLGRLVVTQFLDIWRELRGPTGRDGASGDPSRPPVGEMGIRQI